MFAISTFWEKNTTLLRIFYSGADLLFEQNDNFYNQYEGNSIFVSTKPKQMNIR